MKGEIEEIYDDNERRNTDLLRWDDYGSYTKEYYRVQRDLYRLRQDQWIHNFGMMLPNTDEQYLLVAGEYEDACVPRFCDLAEDDF